MYGHARQASQPAGTSTSQNNQRAWVRRSFSLLLSAHGARPESVADSANLAWSQLANAYQELGKELGTEKLRVVGGYTLGKVIGEGTPCPALAIIAPSRRRHVGESSTDGLLPLDRSSLAVERQVPMGLYSACFLLLLIRQPGPSSGRSGRTSRSWTRPDGSALGNRG